MSKFNCGQRVYVIFLLCLTTAFASSAPAQTFTTLHSFDGTDGASPEAALVQTTNGNLYGTTSLGGINDAGTVFKITPSGELTTLYSFCLYQNCGDGGSPDGKLVQATNGNLYGTASRGGLYDSGTVFKITPSGKLTTLHTFTGSDGANPSGGLVQATNGNLYGTTYNGGLYDSGTVFKITPSGKLTTLYSFCPIGACRDGAGPGGLVQATNGNFYGTTVAGGAYDYGTVFRITPSGKLTTLYLFCAVDCTDGAEPEGELVQGTNGNFYGITNRGGANRVGTVFQITPSGRLTTLYSFCSQGNCTDGRGPEAGLVQATDGNLYGTTSFGGTDGFNGDGTVFQITPSGTLTTLHSFKDRNGRLPAAALVQATNGSLYGTTIEGGASSLGTIFGLDMGLGPFVTFVQAAGKVGQTGGILGQGFTGTTSVSLNGTPANFTVVSNTLIKATVPAGATTGYVTVNTPSGTLTSNVPFHVIP